MQTLDEIISLLLLFAITAAHAYTMKNCLIETCPHALFVYFFFQNVYIRVGYGYTLQRVRINWACKLMKANDHGQNTDNVQNFILTLRVVRDDLFLIRILWSINLPKKKNNKLKITTHRPL